MIDLIYPTDRIIPIKPRKFQMYWFELNLLSSFLWYYFMLLVSINWPGWRIRREPMGLSPWALVIRSILTDIFLNCWTISNNWFCWFVFVSPVIVSSLLLSHSCSFSHLRIMALISLGTLPNLKNIILFCERTFSRDFI